MRRFNPGAKRDTERLERGGFRGAGGAAGCGEDNGATRAVRLRLLFRRGWFESRLLDCFLSLWGVGRR